MPGTKVIVAVCTYHRNEPLTTLLESCLRNADRLQGQASVGVVIVDDSKDQTARPVAKRFETSFELGLHYLSSASGNISTARNMGLEGAAARGDWIAMTDDDCEPEDRWLESLLSVQARTGSDVVTGLMLRRPGAPAPAWLLEQGFLELGEFTAADGQVLTLAFTNNCLISAHWVREQRDLRFDESLGRIGGEDMVFFGLARAKGMCIRFSKQAIVYENEPAERLTFRYQLWRHYWHGNSSYITSVASGKSRPRMLVHGLATAVRAAVRPFRRMIGRRSPQVRYSMALLMQAAGVVVGVLGRRVPHH